ncbi:MAG: cobalamin-dependent protein, partial [Vicinamibacterales bacterium]
MQDQHRDTTFFEVKQPTVLPPLPKDPTPKPFRVLLVYPNYSMVNLLPTNIGILTACLRQNGFVVDLFDTTFYRTAEKTLDEIRVENLQVRKFNFEDAGVRFKTTNYVDDFVRKVEDFKPDLIGVSAVEDTWPQGRTLIEAVSGHAAKVIVGGVLPTLAPEVPIAHPDVDMICVGEGEHAIVELATALMNGDAIASIRNLWVKTADGVVKNPIRPPMPMDDVPFGDFD